MIFLCFKIVLIAVKYRNLFIFIKYKGLKVESVFDRNAVGIHIRFQNLGGFIHGYPSIPREFIQLKLVTNCYEKY